MVSVTRRLRSQLEVYPGLSRRLRVGYASVTRLLHLQILAHLDILMGGRGAEEVIFGKSHVTTGASSDLQQATNMARNMVTGKVSVMGIPNAKHYFQQTIVDLMVNEKPVTSNFDGCTTCPLGAVCFNESLPAPQWCKPGFYNPDVGSQTKGGCRACERYLTHIRASPCQPSAHCRS